jgi:zeaxanthin glucosyltransferase
MATLALVLDHQEGHLLPTFPLARRLLDRGHRVVYLSLADGGEFIRENGFEFAPLFEELFPKGTMASVRTGSAPTATPAPPSASDEASLQRRFVGALVQDPKLARTIADLRPDLLLVSTLFPASALILRFRFDLPVVLLTPYLRRSRKADFANKVVDVLRQIAAAAPPLFKHLMSRRPAISRVEEVASEFLALRELILCPEALEVPEPGRAPEPEVFYIEAPAGRERASERDSDFPWQRLDPQKKLLLVSMGSQIFQMDPEALSRFYRTVAQAAAAEPGWQLVLATGGQVEAADLAELPADAILARWIPQLALLERAAAMVTHGGLGALREAIAHGVPVIVFPMLNDQPANAQRVLHHGLGLASRLDEATPDKLREMLRRIDGEPSFRENVARLRESFLETERSGIGVRLIEELVGAPASVR